MKSKPIILASVMVVLSLAATAIATLPSSASEEPPPPITVEALTPMSEFTDDVSGQLRLKLDGRATDVINVRDASRTVVAKITVQPGARFPWHTHPGPVVANVAEGELVYVYASDCVERPYAAGEVFLDPGHGNVHTAVNRTDDVTVVYATFFEVPDGGPLTITEGVEAPADCELETGSAAH